MISSRRARQEASSLAELAGMADRRLGEPAAAMSGGNQQKVFVSRCLGRDDVYALLLDEPTRGVDIGGRAAMHRLLRAAADAGLVVVFSSTELEELLELGDVIITMREARVVARTRAASTARADARHDPWEPRGMTAADNDNRSATAAAGDALARPAEPGASAPAARVMRGPWPAGVPTRSTSGSSWWCSRSSWPGP